MAQYVINIHKSFMYLLHLWVQITTYYILSTVKVLSGDSGEGCFPIPFPEFHGVRTILGLIIRHYLPSYFSFPHERTVEFSRGYMTSIECYSR